MLRRFAFVLLGLALALPMVSVAAEPPAILLAEVYREQVDVTKYLASEKLDGLRAPTETVEFDHRAGRQVRSASDFKSHSSLLYNMGMEAERTQSTSAHEGAAPASDAAKPEHPWPASIALVTAVVLLIVVLAMVSTFR